MDPLVPQDVQAGREDHPENLDNPEQDEGAGPPVEIVAGERVGHGGRLPSDGAPAPPPSLKSPQPHVPAPLQPYQQPQPCPQERGPLQVFCAFVHLTNT